MSFPWTGDLALDWANLRHLWTRHEEVLQAEVGPTWEMPIEHEVCVRFVDHYPSSRAFLILQLKDSDARVAAYAFKCLTRVTNLRPDDVPPDVLTRHDKITTW